MCIQPPAWADKYIGIPFKAKGRDPKQGLDCWALVCLVLKERFGRELPGFAGIGFAKDQDNREVANFMASAKDDLPLTQIPPGEEMPGDIIWLRALGLPIHVGIVIAPGLMLHTESEVDSCIERYDGPAWRRRIVGFYRCRS